MTDDHPLGRFRRERPKLFTFALVLTAALFLNVGLRLVAPDLGLPGSLPDLPDLPDLPGWADSALNALKRVKNVVIVVLIVLAVIGVIDEDRKRKRSRADAEPGPDA